MIALKKLGVNTEFCSRKLTISAVNPEEIKSGVCALVLPAGCLYVCIVE